MCRFVIVFVFFAVAASGADQKHRFCTSCDDAFNECNALATNPQFSNELECFKEPTSEMCIRAIHTDSSDFFLATSHDYLPAREANLKPIAFERLNNDSLQIIVAPKGISMEQIIAAAVDYDHHVHRSIHAALLFNEKRGRNMCERIRKRSLPNARIEDSAAKNVKDSEVLICPDLTVSDYENYVNCNFEAEIQRAIFVRQDESPDDAVRVRELMNAIVQRYATLDPSDDDLPPSADEDSYVIYRENAIGFDAEPTYINGVDEALFNTLHCDDPDQPHPPVNSNEDPHDHDHAHNH